MKTDSAVKQEYALIDLMKFIMAILVIAIHTDPFIAFNQMLGYKIWTIITSLAVPFFFLASGFFLEIHMTNKQGAGYLGKYLKKIVKLYLIWNIIYMPLSVYGYIAVQSSLKQAVFSYLRGLLFLGEHYNSYVLWYLLSMIYALVFIIFMKKFRIRSLWILAIGSFIWGMGCLLTSYVNGMLAVNGIYDKILSVFSLIFINGRIFTGFFYIPLGIYIGQKRIPRRYVLVEIILFLFGMIIRFSFDTEIMREVGRAISSCCLFNIILSLHTNLSAVNGKKFRSMSTTIYFIHLLVWTLVYTVLYGTKTYGMSSFILTTLLSVTIAYGYTKKKRI